MQGIRIRLSQRRFSFLSVFRFLSVSVSNLQGIISILNLIHMFQFIHVPLCPAASHAHSESIISDKYCNKIQISEELLRNSLSR